MIFNKNNYNFKVGDKVDIAPWSYIWRRDRAVQEYPEADFIPRRIKRQDEVYRTLLPTLGKDADSICYVGQHDTMVEQLPPAKGNLLIGAMWIGGIDDYQIELVWKDNDNIPSLEDTEVRVYPTAWGWFGFSVDKNLVCTEQSEDGFRRTYPCLPDETMDLAYNQRCKSFTQIVAVFAPEGCSVPEIKITGGSLGKFDKIEFKVEWGFDDNLPSFDGNFETNLAVVTDYSIDKENKTAHFSCLYSKEAKYGNESKITFITDSDDMLGATIALKELENGPICIPEANIFVSVADDICAKDYISEQKAQEKMSVRERVIAHGEVTDWEELFTKARLWRCPDGTEIGEFPKTPAPSAVLRVPDKRWEAMYDLAVDQLRGHHMWGMLAFEVARSTYASEIVGLHKEADIIYDYFLESPGIKSDGDFSTGDGSLEWAKTMRHDLGYAHEGTHCSTGRLLYSMSQRYNLTGDREWLDKRLDRLKKAADWIINEANGYMSDTKNREDLHCFGLLPPEMLGDYALPSSDWHWYYFSNAYTQIGLSCFADVLIEINDKDAKYYKTEATKFEKLLALAAKRDALYSPVRRSRDGFAKSFIPRMAYGGGLLHYGKETNIPQFAMGICDLFQGALPLGEIGGVFDADDRRIIGTIDAMEEGGMNISPDGIESLDHPTATAEEKEARDRLAAETAGEKRTATAPAELWFYNSFSNLPKASHNANIYLRQDDIDNFLRFLFNHAIMMVGSNGKLWEHSHPDVFVSCDNPDNGTAAWFVENFRNMMVYEDNNILWIMKGTPRNWLAQDKELEAVDVNTIYGKLTYKTVSDVENGKINVTVEVPERRSVPVLKIRLRHPDKAVIKSVCGNAECTLDKDGETITIVNPKGKIEIVACY